MKRLLRKHEAAVRAVKHSLWSRESKRTRTSTWAKGSLHRTKFCFIFHAPSVRFIATNAKRTPFGVLFALVEATGFEPTTSWSRTMRATNCATPRFCAPWKYTFHKKRIYYNKCNFKCQPFFMGLEKYFLKIFQAPFFILFSEKLLPPIFTLFLFHFSLNIVFHCRAIFSRRDALVF